MKQPRQVHNLLASFTKRHGITKKLLAHDILAGATAELGLLLGGTPLERDVLVVSYAEGLLTFACKHPAARFDMEAFAPALCKRLEERFPAQTFTSRCVVRPEAWKQW